MKYILKKKSQSPFLHSKNSIITDANDEFVSFTGYSRAELIGKSLAEISYILKINSQLQLSNISNNFSCYVFTKSLEPREITISCKVSEHEDEQTYYFNEKLNSRIKDKFIFVDHLYSDNMVGVAVYSFPDLVLLRANEKFLDFFDYPYNVIENSIGKKLKEIVTGYEGSNSEEVFLSVLKTGKPYYNNEFEYKYFKRGITYLDTAVVPIYIKGKAKYVIQTCTEITERVSVRKENEIQAAIIKQQKEQLEAIIENMSDGVCILDKEHNYHLLNSSAKDFFCYPDQVKRHGDSLNNTKYYDLECNLISLENSPATRVLRGEAIKEYVLTCERPDGTHHYILNGSPILDENGKVLKAIICSTNITEQMNNDKLIRMQKDQLEAIIENITDALSIFDKDGNFTRLNKAARENPLTHALQFDSTEDCLKKAEYFYMNKKVIPFEELPHSKVLRGERVLGDRICAKINNNVFYFDMNGSPIYDNDGNFIAGILCSRDITEKIKHEKDLLVKTQFDILNRMIDNLDLPVLRLSYPDFKITDFNQKAYKFIKGLKPELKSASAFKDQNISSIITDFNRELLLKHIENIEEKKETSFSKYRRILMSGEEKFVNMLYQPMIGLNDEILEIVVIIIDVTAETKAKQHIEQNLKMQEEFLANIAHELKTPLNLIFSTIQLIELYLKNDSLKDNIDKITKGVHIIKQNCYRLTKLISNIVDLSRIDFGFFELHLCNENIVTITENVVQSVSEYVESKGMHITFDTNVEEKIIACDPSKIERIMLNLISNAIKFSEPGNEICVDLADKDEVVEISVKDKGIGIDKNYLKTIFERFKQVDKSFSRSTEGSGIGLSLVKSIVELHEGKISADSKLGEGSILKIELPSKTIDESASAKENKSEDSKIEVINIEFSDIYS